MVINPIIVETEAETGSDSQTTQEKNENIDEEGRHRNRDTFNNPCYTFSMIS